MEDDPVLILSMTLPMLDYILHVSVFRKFVYLTYCNVLCTSACVIRFDSVGHVVWQSHIFLLNCDVCCSFPLPEMLGNFCSEIYYFLLLATV